MAKSLLVLSLFVVWILPHPAAAADHFAIIKIDNKSPDFLVSPTLELFGKPPANFIEGPRNHFEANFYLADDEWFDIADIKLEWKNAYLNNDGSKKDFDQRIQLRFRYPFPPSFTFPVYFSNNRSQAEMLRLERQTDDNAQWENYLRGWQIADYFRNTSGPQHPLAQRASWLFFNAADQLAEKNEFYVVMSDDAIAFEKEAFGNTRDVSTQITNGKSAFWQDASWVDRLVPANCAVARILIADLQRAKDRDPALFTARYSGEPNLLNEKTTIINSKCPP